MATESRNPVRRPAPGRNAGLWFGILAALLVLGLLALAVAWNANPAADPAEPRAEPVGAADVTVESLMVDSDQYIGQQVTVAADVRTIFSERVFSVGAGAPVTGNEVLVIAPEDLGPVPANIHEQQETWGDLVLVRGEVRDFNRDEAQQRAGAAMDDNWALAFDGRTVIYAESVELMPQLDENMQGPVIHTRTLVTEFEQHNGQVVTLTGSMTDVVSPNAVVFSDEVLVIGREDVMPMPTDQDPAAGPVAEPIQTGTLAQASGQVRTFDREALMNEFGIELEEQFFRNWDGRPVLIAEQFQLVR